MMAIVQDLPERFLLEIERCGLFPVGLKDQH
jgi:uncharacterized protein (DUF3820 family)